MNYETSPFKPFDPTTFKAIKDSVKIEKKLRREINTCQGIINEMKEYSRKEKPNTTS